VHLSTWLKFLQSKIQIQNGVKIIYGKLQGLFLETLEVLQDFDFVLEVTGDYTGTLTGRGASHEPRGRSGS